MSVIKTNEFVVNQQTRGDERRLVIIEYEVVKTEINRYDIMVKERNFKCDECQLWGECDHQGAYYKNGKWCYE